MNCWPGDRSWQVAFDVGQPAWAHGCWPLHEPCASRATSPQPLQYGVPGVEEWAIPPPRSGWLSGPITPRCLEVCAALI